MDLAQRIAAITQELQAVQREIEHPSTASGVITAPIPDAALLDLKAAVDRMRLFLWAYLDSRGARTQGTLEATLQLLRVQRTAEMLRALRKQLAQSSLPNVPCSHDLASEVRAMAELTSDLREKSA